MEVNTYTLTLKNPKRKWVAGLLWYSSDVSYSKKGDKRSVLNKAEASFKEIHNIEATLPEGGYENRKQKSNTMLSGIIIQTNRSLIVGYGPNTSIPEKSYSLQQLALEHAEKKWALPTVLIRVALDEATHWISHIQRGKLTLSSDRLVSADDSDAEFSKFKAKAEKQLSNANSQLHTIDITSVDKAYSELLKWEKETKSKSLKVIKPFKSLKKTSVTEHKYFKPVFWTGIGLSALISMNFSYSAYQNYQAKLADKERQERLKLLQNVGPAPRPWTEQPFIVPVYQSCVKNFLAISSYRVGWETVKWTCTPDQISREWQRGETGSFSVLPAENGFAVQNPNSITNITQMNSVAARGSVPIVKRDAAARLLMDIARVEGFRITFNWGNENTRRVPRGDDYILESLGHAKHKVLFIGDQMPGANMINNLAKIPSLYLVSVEHSSDRWVLTVEFFAEAK